MKQSYNIGLGSTHKNTFVIYILCVFELILLSLLALEYYDYILVFVGLILAAVFIYISFNHLFFLLLAFLLSILAGSIGSGKSEVSFTNILFPILTVIFFIRLFLDFERRQKQDFVLIKVLFVAFLIWSLFTSLNAVNKSLSLLYWRNYFAGIIVFSFALFVLNDYRKVKTFMIFLTVWGIILALIELYVFSTLGGFPAAFVKVIFRKNLLATSWGKSNYLATFYVLIIPVTIGTFLTLGSKKLKLFLSGSMLFLLTGLILTLSRGGILSLVIAITILISKVLKPRTFIPLLLLITLLTTVFILNPFASILFTGISNVGSSLSYYSRLNFYEDVWKTFLNNPIVGVGFGNLGYHSKFEFTKSVASAHNIVLGMLGETGIVGAILFIFLLCYILFLVIKNYTKEKNERIKVLEWAFISGFIGVLIHSMMEPNFEGFQFAIVFWSTLAVFLRLSSFSDEYKSSLLRT
ncbi:O-antigen ligase family protein [Melioribacteraceae bacterium 4301-Me]|uniref:O-antigen ligase family protein n=1 Tax=Pyranulibacter aquaticus TaxID=3163344 RepID=UPI003596E88A